MKSNYLIVLLLAAALNSVLFSQASFSIPLLLKNADLTDTLRLGVGPNNTFGVDDAASFGLFRDKLAPPLPPTPVFDARFVTPPGHPTTYPIGFGSGMYTDYRGYTAATQIDTFLIKLTGDYADNNNTVISWPSGLDNFGTSWIMQPRSGSSFGPVNMAANTSVTVPAAVYQIYVIKTGAMGTGVKSDVNNNKKEFNLLQNYPNPFNPSTKINFSLLLGGITSLKIYNVVGQEIARLVDGYLPAGQHAVVFDASQFPSGVYLYRLQSNGLTSVKRMVLMK